MDNDIAYSPCGDYVEEDEMPATERELAEDAPWKQIQKNTFTRWCNEHLKCVNKRLANLETDLSDGLRLISLLEVLSQKKMDKYNKRPNFRQMKLENVSVALKFLERERIKLVSIDSKAIVDGNLKLILGLIWTLILHYSISMPMWDEEDQELEQTKATPKQRLLGWIQNKVPQMPITNFNRDWQDGRALGALVDNCAPGLCPQWEDWDPKNKLENATEAMNLADDWLGVAQVIAPEEITNPNVDEHSVMTYLSQFPKAQLKPGAPLRPRTNPKRARAYGKGVEPHGLKVGAPAPFTIETVAAGNGAVLVYLTDPEGHESELKATPNNDKLKTYSVVYHPMIPGDYKVTVLFAGHDIHKSPFSVTVDDTPVDPSKVHAKGPGLQPGNVVGKKTHFEVYTHGAGIGNVDVSISGPNGRVIPEIQQIEECVYKVTYTPRAAGPHEIHVDFAGHDIPKSPYHITVSMPLNPGAVWAEGKGIEPNGVVMRERAPFVVHAEDAGDGQLEVKVVGPRGMNEPVNVEDNGDGTYSCVYVPSKSGQYVVAISYGGKAIPHSPFRVNVAVPADAGRVRVQGPGIEPGNVVGKPTYFDVIATDAGSGEVEATISGPGGNIPVSVESRPNSVYRCTYTPLEKGPHRINVSFAGDSVPHSPFRVDIVPASNASACRAWGRGIQPKGVRAREKAVFHVTTKGAGEAELQVTVKGPRGSSEPVIVKKNPKEPETYDCEYCPLAPGEYTVSVDYGQKAIPKSPFRVAVGKEAGPQKVRAYGPGLHGGKVGHSADFVVETTGTEVGQLGFSIEGPSQARIDCQDKGDGSCDVKYFPLEAGEYAVHVLCDDEDIKDSPFMAMIEPADNQTFPDKVKAYGPGLEESGVVVGRPTEYTVDARSAGRPAPLTNTIVTANGDEVPVRVDDHGDGTYTCKYTPKEPIKHTIIPAYNGVAVKKSPFRVAVQEDSHPERVRVYGPGLKPGLKSEEPTYFTVDCSKAGSGDISIGLKCSPGLTPSQPESDVPFDIIKNDNDTFTVKYTPPVPGTYTIMVLFADVEIPESPVTVSVASDHNANRVRAEGPGLEKEGVESGKPTYFTIYTHGAGKAKPEVKFTPARGEYSAPAKHAEITDDGDAYTYTVKYTPRDKGPMDVHVLYGGDEIPNSPFPVNVSPPLDLNKVRVKGLDDKMEVGKPKDFTVEMKDAGGKGDLAVEAVGPGRNEVPVRMRNAHGEAKCTFVPREEGPYRVDVAYDGVPVQGSPFMVEAYVPPDAGKVRAYGPGLKGGEVDKPALFTIDTTDAGSGGLGLTVEGPCESKIECTDNGDGTCSVSYLPTEPGDYNINVLFADEHIPGSPFKAKIEPAFNPSKVTLSGPGLESGKVGQKSAFVADCSNAGEAPLEVQVINEDGTHVPRVRVHDNGDGTRDVSFTPNKPGDATIKVKYGGEEVPESPKSVKVLPDIDPSSIKVNGPGVESGVLADTEAVFDVDAKRLAPRGGDHIHGKVVAPSGAVLPLKVKDNRDGTYEASYSPYEQGPHKVCVDYDGVEVPGSPFPVDVTEGCDASRVKAYGPGLEGGLTDKAAKFTVDTRGAGTGGLGLAVEGPSDAKIVCTDGKDGTCQVEYYPTEPGNYEVNITYGGENIPGSPFVVPIKDVVDPSKVTCKGPGIMPGVRKNVPQEFVVDCSKAGVAPLEVLAKGPRGVRDPVDVKDNGDGTHNVQYTPTHEGPYQIQVRYADEDVPHSPMRVRVLPTHDAGNVKCSGPGLESTVPASFPVEFMIDAKEAGDGILAVQITNPKREKSLSEVPGNNLRPRKGSSSSESSSDDEKKDPEGYPKKAKIKDNGDGTYNVSYIPDMTGRYTISVRYGGDEVPFSPYRIRALPSGDASKCVVTVIIDGIRGDGLGPNIQVGKEAAISVDASKAGPGKVTCGVVTPDGGVLDADVVENKDKTFDVFYSAPKPGPYVINLRFGGEMVPDSPYHVKAVEALEEPPLIDEEVIEAVDAAPAHAYMNGNDIDALEQGVDGSEVMRPVDFVFEIPQRPGKLTSLVHMPSGKTATPKIIDHKDGTVSISYQPTEPGLHEMDVLFDDEHIAGSPVQFYVNPLAPGHVTAHGPGLVTGRVNKPAHFTIVTKDAGAGGLALAVEGPSKAEIVCKDNKDGTCSVSYIPTAPGEYMITVKFDDEHIAGSPFTANITDGTTPQRAKLMYGTQSDIAFKINETDLSLLTASIRAPSGREEDCQLKQLPNRHIGISFTPHEVGEHLVSVKKFGNHVANSPFKIMVSKSEIGDASKVRVYGPGIEKARAGELAEFFVDTRQAGYGGLGLSIEGPSKVDIDCHDEKDGVCRVTYTPQEPGSYSINIKFADAHVPGSPFTVPCTGESLMQTESIVRHRAAPSVASVGSTCDLNLKIPSGWLQSAVTDESQYGQRSSSAMRQSYSRSEHTTYSHSTAGGLQQKHVTQESRSYGGAIDGTKRQSPFVPIFSHRSELGTYRHTGQLKEANIRELTATVTNPSGHTEDAQIFESGENTYSIRFVPKEMGVHTVSVMYMGEHVPGSPFQFTVGPLGDGGAQKVTAGGPGLESATVNVPADFNIWTREAGAGGLSIAVEGPSKAEINFEDRKDGSCGVSYIASEPGDYEVSVKFNDEHIPGSPFPVTVTGTGSPRYQIFRDKSDASKVTSFGKGLRHAVIGENNTFTVDCESAGSNMLLVGVHGPQTPCEEVYVKHVGNRRYTVTYTAKERGEYTLIVKWGEEHIPGSPFHVKIP